MNYTDLSLEVNNHVTLRQLLCFELQPRAINANESNVYLPSLNYPCKIRPYDILNTFKTNAISFWFIL